MSIKKQLVLAAAGLLAVGGVAFAGGPDNMGPPVSSSFQPSVYMDLNGGYDFYNFDNYRNNVDTIFFSNAKDIKNHDGGFTGGLDVGFQFFKHVGLEVGGYYLPQLKGNNNSATTRNAAVDGGKTSKQWNWMAYVAARLGMQVPYVQDLSVYTKVGAMYRGFYATNQSTTGFARDNHYFGVVYGLGLSYDIAQTGFSAGMQWLNMPSHLTGDESVGGSITNAYGKDVAKRFPSQNLLTANVGYKFAV